MVKILRALVFLAFNYFMFSQQDNYYINPILAGFYPDPSVCKADGNFYLVNSTFAYFPGIPVFKSDNLVNWKLTGHVLDRHEQLNLDGMGVSRGIFAPAIRYKEGVFYVTCTLVDGGGNFIVASKKPEGPWSNPVWLPEVSGIDPSLFFDDNGKSYLIYNSDAPDNKPLYEGHRTIRIYEFDIINLKVTGENKILINGGVDLSKKPVWIEGPHIYKVNGYYYLSAAEGGTAEDHSQVIFRSEKVDGPYSPYEKNPILTQRNLDPRRKYPVTCTGHADFIETRTGEWWAVFLGCRPYEPFEENYYNTGRETFLAPVKWKDGWPVINPDFKEVQYSYPFPLNKKEKVEFPLNGNFKIKDDFNEEKLNGSWLFLRTLRHKWYSLEEKIGFLKINLRPEKVSDPVNPGFIARRQQHSKSYASVSMLFTPKSENEKAGLIIFQDETHFYYLCKSKDKSNNAVQLYKSSADSSSNNMELLISENLKNNGSELLLKIETIGKEYSFFYSEDNINWKLLKDKVDAAFLSIRNAWGFTGNVYAMYATSLGKMSGNSADFDWFEYMGDDDVYKNLSE
ncbi:MAG: glycoside hydrolase family 43 protein [Ignavibacteria bacterium]